MTMKTCSRCASGELRGKSRFVEWFGELNERHAAGYAAGDKSPFAKCALQMAGEAIAKAKV